MKRSALFFFVFLTPLLATSLGAQTPEKVWRLGLLAPSHEALRAFLAIALPALAQHGFVQGRNLLVEGQSGAREDLPDLAKWLVANKPDAIVAMSESAIIPVQRATTVIPIVMSFIGRDPVGLGLVTSWARPGGNVTGLVILTPELEVKRFELLLEAVPGARRIGVLAPRWKEPEQDPRLVALQGAAKRMGVRLVETFAAGPAEYPAAFSALRAASVQALLIAGSPEFFRDGVTLAQLALDTGLPTIGQWREMATQGCLLGYGPSFQELLRQTVEDYVVKIFKGAKPGDLPLAGPTRFQFAINGKTAQSLHLTVPASVVLRADEVIN